MTPQDKRGQAEGIRRQASDIVSLSAPIGLGVFADLLSAPGAIGFAAIAMAGTCAFCFISRRILLRYQRGVFAILASPAVASCTVCACCLHRAQTASFTARQLGFQKEHSSRAMEAVVSTSETRSPEQPQRKPQRVGPVRIK